MKWKPRWTKWNSGSVILPQAKNIVSNPQPRGEKKRMSMFALQKMKKKIIYMLFTHNIVFNYCIVRSECVLGCTVCFRFVWSIGGLSDTCVVRCWCIYTCHTRNFGQCYDQRHFSFFIFLSSKMATRLWYLCMREFLHFTLMCFNYFCSTTKNKQKIRKKNDYYQTFLTYKLNIHVYPTCCLKPKRNFEVK